MNIVAIALGGAFGALLRASTTQMVSKAVSSGFPFATMLVNIVGSLLIGLFYVLIVEKSMLSGQSKDLIMVGFLGSLTTFSTYSLDALLLLKQGQILAAIAYLLLSVVICVLMAALGMYIAKAIF